jgi:hypothetical protein
MFGVYVYFIFFPSNEYFQMKVLGPEHVMYTD